MSPTSTTACSRRPIPRAPSSWPTRPLRSNSLSPSARRYKPVRAGLILLCVLPALPAFAGGEAPVSRPQLASPTLIGVARIPAAALDAQGETLGGFGSGMMLAPGSWTHTKAGYQAKLFMLPDRGWNTAGTTDFRARLQKFDMALTPDTGNPGREGQLHLAFKGTLLLNDPHERHT